MGLAHEGGDTWNPIDIVGHLIHGDHVDWIPRAKVILNDGPARPFDPVDRMAQFSASAGRTLPGLLDEFASVRGACIGELRALGLTPADL